MEARGCKSKVDAKKAFRFFFSGDLFLFYHRYGLLACFAYIYASGIRYSGAGVAVVSHTVGAGNQAQVLCKGSMYS